MRQSILPILQCPACNGPFDLTSEYENEREIRQGWLQCRTGNHRYAIGDGIMRFGEGFGHEAVQSEIEYENSSYDPNDRRLWDRKIIAAGPESLVEIWPHIVHFGSDFRHMIDVMQIGNHHKVLDIGTASCWSSRLLAERGAEVIALDVNDADFYGLKAAEIHFEAHHVYFERVLESMTHLPLADNSMDAITCNASLHHTPDLPLTLKEFFRVLKPGGQAGMTNEGMTSLRHAIAGVIDKLLKREVEHEGSHHDISYREFEDAAQGAGLHIAYQTSLHVEERLSEILGRGVGTAAARMLEKMPILLKQFRSATVVVSKPLA